VRAEAVKYGEQLRHMQHKALLRYLRGRGIKAPIPPRAIITLLAGVGLLRVLEAEAGMSFRHTETDAVVKAALRGLGAGSEEMIRSQHHPRPRTARRSWHNARLDLA